MTQKAAQRIEQIPPYIAFEIDQRKHKVIADGVDMIDFGVGNPDKPTPAFIIDTMAEAIRDPSNHHYALGPGVAEYRRAAAGSLKTRFGVDVDPFAELVPLIGSKDAIAHLPLAFVNPGENVLVPDPGYPAYVSGTLLAGGVAYAMPLQAEKDWLPDLSAIPSDVARAARILYLNYPNNPTGAVAPFSYFNEAVAFARDWDILLVHDAPYIDICFDGPHPSVLQADGAMDHAIELHSFSKSFNMAGWRIGYAAGCGDAIRILARTKSYTDSGPFKAIQWAAAKALTGPAGTEHLCKTTEMYRRRRDLLVTGLREMGLAVEPPRGAFYVWIRCPEGMDSMSIARRLLDDAAVTVFPGVGFGSAGEGYFRMGLTVPEDRIREAVERMRKIL